MKTLIITGGCICLEYLEQWIEFNAVDCCIAVDKGLESIYALRMRGLEIHPDYILGDYDSVAFGILELYQETCEVHKFSPQKDDTDTALAIQLAMKQGASEIHIWGATGKRIDHEFANIGLLYQCDQAGVVAYIYDEYNCIRMIHESCEVLRDTIYNKYISIIPYSNEVTGITLTGFVYPLEDATMRLGDGIGISNEFIDKLGYIKLESGSVLLIQSRD